MKPMNEKQLGTLRRHMVEVVNIHLEQMADELGRDRLDPRLEAAMLRVPRHLFVPSQLGSVAYHDGPLPIGFDKTLSQPFIGALMIELLDVEPGQRVLEVGTGLGYQAALLSELGVDLYTVEIVEEFAAAAEQQLRQLGFLQAEVRVGDGSRGWPEYAPYDRILVTAAAASPPQPLLAQLRTGGRMVIPLGGKEVQQLSVAARVADDAVEIEELLPVRFTRLETGG